MASASSSALGAPRRNWSDLPEFFLASVLSTSHVLDRASAACVCRAWRAVAAVPGVWADLDLRCDARMPSLGLYYRRFPFADRVDVRDVVGAKLWLRAGAALRRVLVDAGGFLNPSDAEEIAGVVRSATAPVAVSIFLRCEDAREARAAARAARSLPAGCAHLALSGDAPRAFASEVLASWPEAVAEVTLSPAKDPAEAFATAPAMKCPVHFVCKARARASGAPFRYRASADVRARNRSRPAHGTSREPCARARALGASRCPSAALTTVNYSCWVWHSSPRARNSSPSIWKTTPPWATPASRRWRASSRARPRCAQCG